MCRSFLRRRNGWDIRSRVKVVSRDHSDSECSGAERGKENRHRKRAMTMMTISFFIRPADQFGVLSVDGFHAYVCTAQDHLTKGARVSCALCTY